MEKPTKEDLAETKTLAKKLLNIFGEKGQHWITGQLHNGVGDYCLMGGIIELRRTRQINSTSRARTLLTRNLPHHKNDSVEYFNDSSRWPTIHKFLKRLAAFGH